MPQPTTREIIAGWFRWMKENPLEAALGFLVVLFILDLEDCSTSPAVAASRATLWPRVRLPRGGQRLGLVDLSQGHLGSDLLAIVLQLRHLRRSQGKPHVGLNEVLRNTNAIG
jgi:hypothetical protein